MSGRWLLVIAALCWSLSGVLIKLSETSGLVVAFYRSFIAALVLFPWGLRSRQRFDMGTLWTALAYTGTVVFLVLATKATSAANAIFLQYTAPAVVFVLSIPMLGEIPRRREWLVLTVIMIGVLVIYLGAGTADLMGICLGLASGLAFGILVILVRKYPGRDPIWGVFCNNTLVALLLFPWIKADFWIGHSDLVIMLLLGVVQLGIPYVIFYYGMRRVVAREGALIALLEPLLNPVWVVLVVGEIPSSTTIVGGGIILVGLTWCYLRQLWWVKTTQNNYSLTCLVKIVTNLYDCISPDTMALHA